MRYRRLGKTDLMVSEIGFGGEWLERMELEDCRALFKICREQGINILDCWMSEPNVRSAIGECIKGSRENGIYRATLAPPGRMASMCAPVIFPRSKRPLRICLPDCRRTT